MKLQRAGREWKAPCPFHNERTPSFYVNDDKGFYHCFGCSAHGDAIRWMTDQQGLPFMDAVKELAQAAGMDVPAADRQAKKRQERAAGLHDVCAAAQDVFERALEGIEGAEARAYLERRGIRPETARAFGLGFAPDSRGRLRSELKRFGDAMLIEAGLLIQVEDKEPYDRFRGRLMIAIRDPRGRVIAFGGRVIGQGEPKYLNSPDTPLFDKGRTLYNLDRAAPAARAANRVIVVEGYLDVLALAQAGIAEAVAPLGTALTEMQIERLWRLHDAPLLCFDGDSAGRKASARAALRALPGLRPGRTLSFLTLPNGKDPDDIVRTGGASAFERIVATAEPLDERLWRHEFEAAPLATPEAKAGLKRRLADHARTIVNTDVREQYVQAFRRRFDALYASHEQRRATHLRFREERRNFPHPAAAPSDSSRAISSIGIDPVLGREILAGFLRYPAILPHCVETLSVLIIGEPGLEALRRLLLDSVYSGESLESESLRPILGAAGLDGLAAELLGANRMRFSFSRPQAGIETALRDLKLALEAIASEIELDAAIAAVTERLASEAQASDFEEQLRLVAARRDVKDRLAQLASGEDQPQ